MRLTSILSFLFSLCLTSNLAWAQIPAPSPDPNLQSQLQADLSQCTNQKSQAELCCGDPAQCASGMSPEAQAQLGQLAAMGAMGAMAFMQSKDQSGEGGMNQAGIMMACQMLSALGSMGSGVNSGGAEVCNKERESCNSICSERSADWKQKLETCKTSQCADLDFLTQAVADFESSKSTCSDLQANSESMKEQSEESGQSGGVGELCSQLASMVPASAPPEAEQLPTINCNDPVQFQANIALCIDCKADPENKNCGKVLADKGPKIGFDAATDSASLDSFNTSNTDGLDQQPQFGGFEAQANRSGTVSGSGGGIPGGGNDGGNFGSSEDANPGGGGGYNTSILSGERGGGGYSASVASMGVEGGGGFSGYGSGAPDDGENSYQGMDLKKYLPGGAFDPSRRLASVLVDSGQINSKNANIFERISSRIKSVCSTKRLKGCGGSPN